MVQLHKACRNQVAAHIGGELVMPSVEVRENSGKVFADSRRRFEGPIWNALLRVIAEQEEEYSR